MSASDDMGRREIALRQIKLYSAAAVAPGLVPVPVLDAGLVAAVQVALVHKLAGLYEVPFETQRTTALVSALVGGGASVSLGFGIIGLLRVAGPIAGVLTVGTLGAASTWAVGQVFTQHFETGGTFLTFDPERMKAHYAELLSAKAIESKRRAETPVEGPRRP